MPAQTDNQQGIIRTSYDYAVHSDFLIHWTGKDIDQANEPRWDDDYHSSRTSPKVVQLYLDRLKDITNYGLWMTEQGERKFKVGSAEITIPSTPQCCFTELKVSESRRHARNYGRLGIGVKRPFLFRRFGRPVAYFGFGVQNHSDKFLEACVADLSNKDLLNFFMPMNSKANILNYDLYSESEWKLLFSSELLKTRKIVDPRDSKNTREHGYFNSLNQEQQNRLRYLVPLDGWFAMIIYPSGPIKNAVRWKQENGIWAQIERIKLNDDHGNRVEGNNWPIEVDLDACRHL
jgi:Putative abortive phage resistance protein AbiGi, antitoxin